MKVVQQSFELMLPEMYNSDSVESVQHYFDDQLRLIEDAGRTCYKSEDRIGEDSAAVFAKKLVKNMHGAMLEFGHLTVRFITNRGVLAEFTRHRLCSFAVESTRYCNYSKDKFNNEVTFIEPAMWHTYTDEAKQVWTFSIASAETTYLKLLELGLTPQLARGVLPNDLKTEICVSANFREWRHIFNLRCSTAAHPDIRAVMSELHTLCVNKCPSVFGE